MGFPRQEYWSGSVYSFKLCLQDFPGGPVVKNLPASAGDMDLIPGLKRCRMPQDNYTHMHNNPPREFMLSILITFGSAGSELLIPKGGTVPLGNTVRVPLNQTEAMPEHFKLLV